MVTEIKFSKYLNYEKILDKNKKYTSVSDHSEEYKSFIKYCDENDITISIRTASLDEISLSKKILFLIPFEEVKNIEDYIPFENKKVLRIEPKSFLEFAVSYGLIKKYPFEFLFVFSLGNLYEIDLALDWIRSLDKSIQKRILIHGIGQCLVKDDDVFSLTVHGALDVEAIIENNIKRNILPFERVSAQIKKAECKKCHRLKTCYGIPKISELGVIPQSSPSSKKYISVYDFYQKHHRPINSGIIEFTPSKWETEPGTEVLASLQERRLKGNFHGHDFFYLWDFTEPFYFNRPLEETTMFQRDPRGLMSINWQFIGKDIPELRWKQKCDMLIPHEGISTTVKIKFDDTWSEKEQEELDNFTFESLKDIILSSGGDSSKLKQAGNDLLYGGKKFSGKEWKLLKNVGYIENVVITCDYEKEKQWFDKIYHWDGEKPITGITNEVPSITKELLLKELSSRLNNLLKK